MYKFERTGFMRNECENVRKINFFILQRYIVTKIYAREIILIILFSLRDIGERIFKRGKIEIFYDYIMIIQLCVERFFEF